MIYTINKGLILEDYMQAMIDGMDHNDAVSKFGEPVEHNVQDEHILDEYKVINQNGAKVPVPKYDEFNKNSLKIIRNAADKYDAPYEDSVKNSHTFMKTIGNIENSGHTFGGNNSGTSAKGLYQNTNGNVSTAINRTARVLDKGENPWMDEAKQHPNANNLTRQQQTNMTMGNIYNHGRSRPYLAGALEGDTSDQKELYNKVHHTRPDQLTAMVRDREFKRKV